MQIVIDIPEEIKVVIDKNGTNEIVAEILWQAVKNGTPISDNATNDKIIEKIKNIDADNLSGNYVKALCIDFLISERR